VRGTSWQPGSYERALSRLLGDALGKDDAPDRSRAAVTICAPRWVLDRISEETCLPVVSDAPLATLAIGALVVAAVPALERDDGLGFLAAVNVISGRCIDLIACHRDVPPNRWPDLTLALACGLGSPAAISIEMIGASAVG
jgi:hypothetical protein